MNKGRVTIAEVAAAAGVSTATVSRVLNSRLGSLPISEVTKAAVHDAADRLGYIPNYAAQSLRSRRSGAVTMLISNLVNPFFTDIAAAAQTTATQHGYRLQLVDVSHAETMVRTLEHLRGGGSDGVLIAVGHNSTRGEKLELVQHLGQRGIPSVMVLDYSPDGMIPAVRVDNELSTYLATQHLIRLGHQRIGFLTVGPDETVGGGTSSRIDRRAGYERALVENGLTPDAQWIVRDTPDPTLNTGRVLMHRLWAKSVRRPTAVVTFNDQIGLGALRALAELGVRAPDDMAVVGTGGIDMGAYSVPALSTIYMPRDELGSLGASTLFDLLDGKQPALVERVLPIHLVIRESCGGKPAVNPSEESL